MPGKSICIVCGNHLVCVVVFGACAIDHMFAFLSCLGNIGVGFLESLSCLQ